MDIPERYVRLCLQVGRHIDGIIDAYIGPPGWEKTAAAGEPVEPKRLRDETQSLLAGLDGADLEDDRKRWLRGQVEALRCMTGRLAGEEIAWVDEVERCLGVRPTRTDDNVIEDVHRRLDVVLAGPGSVRERYIAWDENNAIPREQLVPTLERLKEVLRPRAHEIAPLPPEESVTYELVSDKAWLAYNWYQGGNRSRVEVNADLPISICVLVDLAAHEAYPGHHTERTLKDERLHRGLDRLETSVVVLSTPESLISEGIAMNALEEALGERPFDAVADILADLGVTFDAAEAHEVYRADIALFATGTNAAFMLHEDGATDEQVEEYQREWALASDERAAHSLGFMRDPSSRAYVPAYTDGRKLCRAFADAGPGNFTRLLTEQLTTADLLPAA